MPSEAPLHPHEVMRRVYEAMEFNFDEEDGKFSFRLQLENMDVEVVSWGTPDDVATLLVRLPVRATTKFRAKAGEFLHRLNFGSKRKFWEIDYNDGEIRMAGYTDIISVPLTEELFRGMLHFVVKTADTAFPYLTSVLSGGMKPDFAADQAEAALQNAWKKTEETEEE